MNYGEIIFSHRIRSIWNSLPDNVVFSESVNRFKSRLDKFRSVHDFLSAYRANPLAAGSYNLHVIVTL